MTDAEKLLRLERANIRHYRFLRETPREERHIQFAPEDKQPTAEEAVLSVLLVAVFAAAAYMALSL